MSGYYDCSSCNKGFHERNGYQCDSCYGALLCNKCITRNKFDGIIIKTLNKSYYICSECKTHKDYYDVVEIISEKILKQKYLV